MKFLLQDNFFFVFREKMKTLKLFNNDREFSLDKCNIKRSLIYNFFIIKKKPLSANDI